MNKIICGDSLHALKEIEPETIDVLVTDPPYGYSFMGKAWDKTLPDIGIFKECLRVLKPGAFAFVMSAPRSDVCARMMLLLEDSGFNIGFTPIYWTYASGFPKAMNIGKMVDKRNGRQPEQYQELGTYLRAQRGTRPQKELASFFPSKTGGLTGCVANWELGLNVPTKTQYQVLKRELKLDDRFDELIERAEAEREIIGQKESGIGTAFGDGEWQSGKAQTVDITTATTDQAKALDGSYGGFQPKPAVEVVIVAMKPLSEKTYVDQALKNGKGITWLDDGRIPGEPYTINTFDSGAKPFGGAVGEAFTGREQQGRFPANLLVENSILDTISCTCTHEGNIPTVREGLNSEEDGIEATTQNVSHTRKRQGGKSQKLTKASGSPLNTEPRSPQPESLFTINGEESHTEAQTETVLTGDGCVPCESGTETNASSAEQLKTSTSTTSSLTPASPNSSTKSATGAYCALHATGKPRPTESNQQYSRFFSLDAWAKTLPFLIVPKASKREKNEGLERFDKKIIKTSLNTKNGSGERLDGATSSVAANFHPTVKPLTLMSYLITLGSRPGDVVLDPFIGSGTTAIAAKQLGRKYIGIEREAEYVEIAQARLNAVPDTLL